jgi:DNA-binding MarR family transcriptional regulator
MDQRIGKLTKALAVFGEVNDEFAIRHLQIFLYIASHPGCSPSEICEVHGISQASVSRAVIFMYSRDRSRHRSPDIVYYDIPKDDMRRKLLYLTPFGHSLLRKALDSIEKG